MYTDCYFCSALFLAGLATHRRTVPVRRTGALHSLRRAASVPRPWPCPSVRGIFRLYRSLRRACRGMTLMSWQRRMWPQSLPAGAEGARFEAAADAIRLARGRRSDVRVGSFVAAVDSNHMSHHGAIVCATNALTLILAPALLPLLLLHHCFPKRLHRPCPCSWPRSCPCRCLCLFFCPCPAESP